MGEKAEYRSAIRSRNLIRKAFLELMQEKEIHKITVKEVIEKADINRGTFYAHYADIYDVLEQIENEFISKILSFIADFNTEEILKNPLPLTLKVSSYIEEDLEFHRLLINSKGSSQCKNKIKLLFIEQFMSDTVTLSKIKNREEIIICINFLSSGIVGLYEDWFKGKINVSLTELAIISNQLITKGLQSFI